MVVFNYSTRELTTKIVYYGPGLCGKTTNLQFIYDHMPENVRGKMLSLATKSDRTLFFDFLPIDLGQLGGMKTKVQLYTVPGQVFYNETRRLVLKGADGVVFVADSQDSMLEANLESYRNLEENLAAHGLALAEMPHVLQYNKRDLPSALPLDLLNEKLNRHNAPFYDAVATTGVGVQETLRHITKLVLLKLDTRYGAGAELRPTPPPPAAAPFAPRAAASPIEPPAAPPRPAEAPAFVSGPAPAAAPRTFAPAAPAFAPPPEPKPAPAPAFAAAAQAPAWAPPAEEENPLALAPASSAADMAAEDDDPLGLVHEIPAAAPPVVGFAGETQRVDRDELMRAFRAAPPAAPVVEAEAPAAPAPIVEAPAPKAPEEAAEGVSAPPVVAPETIESPIVAAPFEAPTIAAPIAASAAAVEVEPEDAAFHEEGVEITRLAPGEPQEIIVPLEVATPFGPRLFRLTLRLEIKP